MKVLYVTTAFCRYPGDVITPWLVKTIEKLKEKGIEVEVFTSSYKGLKSQEIFGIKVHRFRYFFKRWEDLTHEENVPDRLKRSWRYKFILPFYLFFGIIEIYRLGKRERYDIIQCHWPLPHTLFGYFGKKAAKSKLISSFYGVELKWLKGRLSPLTPFLKWLISKSDAITAISTYTAKMVEKFYPKKVEIIPFGAAVEIEEGREVMGRSSSPQLLFVGRLVERKGVEYLLRALAVVRKEVPAVLTVIGDGRERKRLESLARELGISEAVRFLGFVSSPELAKYYKECDIFILPAIYDRRGDTEMLGVVLLEAMSYKKPVIASDVGGISDIVKDRATGILVREKSVDELKEALLLLLRDENLRREIGERGYQFGRERFSWERIVGQLEELYFRLKGVKGGDLAISNPMDKLALRADSDQFGL